MSDQERCPTCGSDKKEAQWCRICKAPYQDGGICVRSWLPKTHTFSHCSHPWHDSAHSHVAEQPSREQAVEGCTCDFEKMTNDLYEPCAYCRKCYDLRTVMRSYAEHVYRQRSQAVEGLVEALKRIADDATYRGFAKRAVFLRAIARDALARYEASRGGKQ